MYDTLGIVSLTILGALVGSFLNVVIHRLPRMIRHGDGRGGDSGVPPRGVAADPTLAFNLAVPRSFCPGCGQTVRALENIPLISFLLLRGRCSGCGWRIPARYPLVELLGAIGALASVLAYGVSVQGGAAMVFIWGAVAISFIDIEHMLVPDRLSLPLLWAGLLVNSFAVFIVPESAILGAAIGYATFWAINALASRIYGRTAIGQGDFKLFAAIGAWLGWQALSPVLLIASALGATVGCILLYSGRMESGHPISFAPFLVIGGVAVLLSDGWIVAWFAGLAHL